MHFYFFSSVTLSSHSYLYSVIAAVACKTITTMGSRVSSSIESNLEAVAPEEDIALVLRWCLSIGLETILDISGMQECELLALCPDHLKTRIPPFHRMACRLKRDNLEARAISKLSSLLPERYAFVPPELLHKSHLKGNPKAPGKRQCREGEVPQGSQIAAHHDGRQGFLISTGNRMGNIQTEVSGPRASLARSDGGSNL